LNIEINKPIPNKDIIENLENVLSKEAKTRAQGARIRSKEDEIEFDEQSIFSVESEIKQKEQKLKN